MLTLGTHVVQSWIAWIEFWDRIVAAERSRLSAERQTRAQAH